MVARTKRESNRRRSGRLVGATITTKELAEWRRFQRKNLEHTKPEEKERVASVLRREQLASTPEPPLPKKQEQSRLARVPDHEEEKVKVS